MDIYKIILHPTILLAFVFSYACQMNHEDSEPRTIFLKNAGNEKVFFEDVFELADSFSFDYGEQDERFVSWISKLVFNSKGEIFLVQQGSIERFSPDGRFISDFGSSGKGPGEFLYSVDYNIDVEDRFWLYDTGQKRFIVFGLSDGEYEYEGIVEVDHATGKFSISDSSIFFYSNYDESLLTAYDVRGNLQNKGFFIEDIDLRTFLSRFNGGGLCYNPTTEILYAIFPGEYVIRKFSRSLEQIGMLRSLPGESYPFRPEIPEFTGVFDPFDFTDKQKDWYNSFDHIDNLRWLAPSYLIVELYGEYEDHEAEFYLNLYTEEGEILGEQMHLPEDTRLVGVDGNNIYLALQESIHSDGTIEPIRIFTYYVKPS